MKTELLAILFILLPLIGTVSQEKVPPGDIINHISKSTEKYIGSPSICILPNGDYVASHDEFGPKSSEYKSAITTVYKSSDKGHTWRLISKIDGQFWSTLFDIGDDLYIMGTNKVHGNVVIRKSIDKGENWTIPYNSKNGLILEGEYHTAPVPVVIHKGRVWRSVEYATGISTKWPERYSAAMLSAPVKSDLLNSKNWIRSNILPFDETYLNNNFKGWLEGNAVVGIKGDIFNILRVHTPTLPDEYAAITKISKKGKKISFNKDNFVKMPGASKKFTIRFDEKTKKYWSLVSGITEQYDNVQPDRIRNNLMLISADNFFNWKIEATILSHPDYTKHGFQYVDWLFDEEDIIFVSRTAYDDFEGGASNYHNTNFITFHRIKNFRKIIN